MFLFGNLYFLQSYRSDTSALLVLSQLLMLFFFFVTVFYMIGRFREVIATAHWYHRFDDFQFSTQEFYRTLEEAIQAIAVPGLGTARKLYLEGGIASANREYLRVSRYSLVFDICAAPFGTGFFVSWWQGEKPNFLRNFIGALPYLGPRIERGIYRKTYYQLDTEQVFQDTIHELVVALVNRIANEKGVRGVAELERVPTLVQGR